MRLARSLSTYFEVYVLLRIPGEASVIGGDMRNVRNAAFPFHLAARERTEKRFCEGNYLYCTVLCEYSKFSSASAAV